MVLTWKRFLHYYPFVRESIDHRGPLTNNTGFDVFLGVSLNKPLNKPLSCRWFKKPRDVNVMTSSNISWFSVRENLIISGTVCCHHNNLRCHRWRLSETLPWRHNGRDSDSNHQPHDCLLNRVFRRRSKKTSKLRVTGLCAGNSPGTGEFPAQRASYAENVSIWWRHHKIISLVRKYISVFLCSGQISARVECQSWSGWVVLSVPGIWLRC